MRLDITATDAQKDEQNLNHICIHLKYSGFHNGNAETKMQFLKRKLLETMRRWVRSGWGESISELEIPTE